MTTQPKLSNRIILWSILLALLSLEDLALTILALNGVPTARELNPIANVALQHGVLAATALKVSSMILAVAVAAYLARRGFETRVHKTLVAWSAFYIILNGVSTLDLMGGLS
jgi:hypothetical protein